MSFTHIRDSVSAYYTQKLRANGPNARGVDWNSTESQVLRFDQLLKVCPSARDFSLFDYGCGYGALYDYLCSRGLSCDYCGFDISAAMIATARAQHPGASRCLFTDADAALTAADYAVASGIFNVRQNVPDAVWWEYTRTTLGRLAELSRHGFAFNMLTSYSDPERMRPDLYYPDPCKIFDYCKRTFSRQVALLHDYGLYEFTIHVRL